MIAFEIATGIALAVASILIVIDVLKLYLP